MVDLESLAVTGGLQLGFPPFDLACPEDGKLYVSVKGDQSRPSLHVVDLESRTCLGHHDHPWIRGDALLEARRDVPGVFVATDSMPTTIFWVDFATGPFGLQKLHDHDAVGGAPRDMSLGPEGKRLYVSSGSPYYVQVLHSDTLVPVGRLDTGPHPTGAAPSPDGTKVFVTHGKEHVDVFDAKTFLKIGSFSASAEPVGVGVTGDGQKIVVLFPTGLWIRNVSDMEERALDE